MRVNSSILTLIPHLVQPDRLFQQKTDNLFYGHAPPHSNVMPARLETFHEGEAAMRALLQVPLGRNPTATGLPLHYAVRVATSPLAAVGTLDAQGRPWTTLWGGARGFAELIAPGVLGLNSSVDTAHDPVYQALWGEEEQAARGGMVQPNDGAGKMMAALALDLESRDRVKLMGAMVAGSADVKDNKLQMAFLVTESLGNCPKYLNRKRVQLRAYGEDIEVVEGGQGRMLPEQAIELLDEADMFFLSSTHGASMDTNHRGGPPGFVRVLKNGADEAVLVYPEYSGNRLYQTLGNLKVNPLVGIVVPDFASSDVLYLSGSASILVGPAAAALLPRTPLAVQVTITAARFVRRGLPFRGTDLERSPYNPPVRHLFTERDAVPSKFTDRPDVTATLVDREVLSPTVARFTFRLGGEREKMKWHAGQHVTLDFGKELDHGYAHMRDDDPQSLNDDFVRTFTVSNPPPPDMAAAEKFIELQITARRSGGPATGLLWRQNLRAPLAIPVLGFGGQDSFRLPTTTTTTAAAAADTPQLRSVFVAGGVGITPLLAQARAVLDAGVPLTLLWSLRGEDLPLAEDTFARIEGLAAVTTVFFSSGGDGEEEGELRRRLGVKGVQQRRMAEVDIKGLGRQGTRFYLCAGPSLLRYLQGWLHGEDVVWEEFGY
ncbi:hypothetical protein MY5147_006551 [Beauveria neobassiana]